MKRKRIYLCLAHALDKSNIEARPVWEPMHKQPCYKDAPAYVNGVSEANFKVGMCQPCRADGFGR